MYIAALFLLAAELEEPDLAELEEPDLADVEEPGLADVEEALLAAFLDAFLARTRRLTAALRPRLRPRLRAPSRSVLKIIGIITAVTATMNNIPDKTINGVLDLERNKAIITAT